MGRDAWREGHQGQGRDRCSRSGNIMNRSARSLSAPAELMFLMGSHVCCQEKRDFEALRLMMIEEIRPETKIEWLWLLDLVERSWEILRYRRLKQRMLDVREAAIACILHRINQTC